jgi:hypothetical protein
LIKFVKLKNESKALMDIIPPLIERFRLGVVGYFSRRQDFIQGSYVGKGVYSAVMEGFRVEIHVMSNTVEKIICGNETELKFLSNTLYDFIKDLGWNLLHRKHIGDVEYWDFNSRRKSKFKNQKTVFVVFEKLKSLTTITGSNLELEVSSYNNIRLINVDGDRRYTILSYRIKTKDLGFNDTHIETEDDKKLPNFVSKWIRSDSAIVSEIEDKILIDPDFEQWSTETLKNRLIGLNRIPNMNLQTIIELSEDPIEISDIAIDAETAGNLDFALSTAGDESEMFALFGSVDDVSSESSEGVELERLVLFGDESAGKDFSWLDFLKSPFKPGLTIDSSITNKFFDNFIQEYIEVLGATFMKSFIYSKPDLINMINIKRRRKIENLTLGGSSFVDMV